MLSYKDDITSRLLDNLTPLGQHSGEQYPAAGGEAPQEHAIWQDGWCPLSGEEEIATPDSHEGAAAGDLCASGYAHQAAQDHWTGDARAEVGHE